MPSTTGLPTGVEGLDDILRGGLPDANLHLVQGAPGTGKTTLALQFLLAGVAVGERALYVSLSQTRAELEGIARSHGWSLEGVEIVELQAEPESAQTEQTIFRTADLHLDETRRAIREAIDAVAPHRLVYDSLLEVRLLASDLSRYHRELIGLKAFLSRRGITTILIDTEPDDEPVLDMQARGLVHGVLTMSKRLPQFGRAKRRIEVSKMRGRAIYDGYHDMDIRDGTGVVVFPRVVAARAADESLPALRTGELIQSGLERLDNMFGGGQEPGTTTMVVGQAGTGKSTIASLYATAALERGESVALFLFEERLETFFRRSEGLGMNLRDYHEQGQLKIFDFNPNEISPGEFGQIVQKAAEDEKLRMVVIDSFTGYMSALANEEQALYDIQSLLKFLARRNILTMLIVAQHGLIGAVGEVGLDLSFLGDTVLLLRMREVGGGVRRSIVAVKKRHGPHALSVHELIIETGRVDVSEGSFADAH